MMKKRRYLGNYACKVLLYALPVMILLVLALTVYVARLDAVSLMLERETIFAFLEAFGRLFVCVSLGVVLADIAEKKQKENA